MMVVV
jgi:hypothetical protein